MANDWFPKWIEGKGIGLRKHLTLSPYDILNPFDLAISMGVFVLSLEDAEIPDEIKTQLLNNPTSWDAGCMKLPNDKALILYNPIHAKTRIRATIMEELAHLYLNHKGSKLTHIDGVCCRTYKKSDEKQAYAVGSAALLPMLLLKNAQSIGKSRSKLASECNVSPSLVNYRINVTKIQLR